MTYTIDAIYENGVLKPIEPLPGLADRSRVKITIEQKAADSTLLQFAGTLPADVADEMLRVIEDEFERIDPDDWR